MTGFGRAARLDRERRTVAAMIAIFCRDRHASDGQLCEECSELEAYTRLRLAKCPYGAEKPTCVNCPIHCYQPRRREEIRGVMAYSGPRILLSHPMLAIRHMIDGRRKAPPGRRGQGSKFKVQEKPEGHREPGTVPGEAGRN